MSTGAPPRPTAEKGQRCGICGSSRAATLFPGVDAAVRCRDCGVGYTVDAPPPGADDLLNDAYYRDYFERGGQWRYEARRRLRWLHGTAHPQQLLEIGSAGGFFLDVARQAGIDARGVELSPISASYARSQLEVPVHVGTFEEFTPPLRFEAICAFHVLEHVLDPAAFLHCAGEALVRGGVLAIEVPNVASHRARRSGGSWVDLRIPYHRWHFSPDPLRRLVEGVGLAVERVDTVSRRFYMTPRDRATRPGLTLLAEDLLAMSQINRVPRSLRGDYLRLIAVKR